jgi:cell wall-associated NlpC family hydrolase
VRLFSKKRQNGKPGRAFRPSRTLGTLGLVICAIALAGPAAAQGGSGGVGVGGSGGHASTVPGAKAKLRNGKAIAPASAPARVKRAIAAANRIAGKPYKYGGGHGSWKDSGYDCSGAVSYALGKPGAKLLSAPMPSTGFMKHGWGVGGQGKWITTYANSGHMYAMIAGLRFESHTTGNGPGWSNEGPTKAGYVKRHAKSL